MATAALPRILLVLASLTALAHVAPVLAEERLPSGSAQSSAELGLAATRDTWANQLRPDSNYGSASVLRVAGGALAYIRFDLSPWHGMGVADMTLSLGDVAGAATSLRVDEADNSWKEGSLTWRNRPAAIAPVAATFSSSGTSAQVSVASLFPAGVVDQNFLTLRLRSETGADITFSSREGSAAPRLLLSAQRHLTAEQLVPAEDAWVNSSRPDRNYGAAHVLRVDGVPRNEAYLKFDLSGWRGQAVASVTLEIQARFGEARLSAFRTGTRWRENAVTWNSRPSTGTLIGSANASAAASPVLIDVTDAFGNGTIDRAMLGLRIATSSADGFDFYSREAAAKPVLHIDPTAPPTPTPSPTPEPTAPPTPTPSPTPEPTAPPTPTPSPTPEPTAPPTPTPSPTPEPEYYFWGRGTDHGAGMSQYGARGRALAGQTSEQILSFYYTGVAMTPIDGTQPIRVLLQEDFVPPSQLPARVTAAVGGMTSALFPGVELVEGSYILIRPPAPTPSPTPTPPPPSPTPAPTAEPTATPSPAPTAEPTSTPSPAPTAEPTQTPSPTLEPTPTPSPTEPPVPEGHWIVKAYDPTGVELAAATTADLVVDSVAPDGLLGARYRDGQVNDRLYRGSMRMIVTPSGLMTVNTLSLEAYLRGVVACEMPASWPLEALKAQAVAARTYAWSRMFKDRTWDVLPGAAHQVYGGYARERPSTDLAVLETTGTILTYNGRIVRALYHSTAGGHTENSEYAFMTDAGTPGSKVAYLRGKLDVDENGVPYEYGTHHFYWQSHAFTMAELSSIFANDSRTNVGQILDIVYERGVSGRVYRITMSGTTASVTISGGMFKNVYNAHRLSGPELRSTMYFLERSPPPSP